MKVTELRDLLVGWCERHPRDAETTRVVIATKNGGCPTMYMSDVISAVPGCDWTAGRFVLSAKDRLMVENNITAPLEEVAAKHLAELDSVIIGGPHVPKSHRRSWMDGFAEGVRAHYTGQAPAGEKGPVKR